MTVFRNSILFSCLFAGLIFAKTQFSDLRVFNRTILLVKEEYVQPDRFNPEKMLMGALDALEKKIPEVVVLEPFNGKVKVQIRKSSKSFDIRGMKSLWDLSFKLREIAQFIEPKLPKAIDLPDIEYALVNGTLSQLDPHSTLLPPRYSKEMKSNTKGHFGGLGVVIGLRDGSLTVISPVDDTPASRAGIKALDQIIKINESSTINLELDDAVEKLRGKPGTKVDITVKRKGKSKPYLFKLKRDIIKVASTSSQLIDDSIGYVKVKAFQGNTGKDVQKAVLDFQKKLKGKLKGLVLDFRNNPGGLLSESVNISDLFLDGGTVVVTQGAAASRRDEEKASAGLEKTRLPIVVIVNSGSASASEIVAGALKNRNRALIIGEQTFGKGSVQMLYDLPDKSSLKLTIAHYLTPGNESIQSVGITPDILMMPAYVSDKNDLLLFPRTNIREGDLDEHLDNSKKVIIRKPEYEFRYISKKLSSDELEEKNISSKFKEDFEVRFAKRLLQEVTGQTREALLKTASEIMPIIEQEENDKLEKALTGFGVDWSLPKKASFGKSKLKFELLSQVLSKAGEKVKVRVKATNIGKNTVYRLYGVSDSKSYFLLDKEFVFGKIPPGQSRIWETEIELPKEVLTRKDLMRVEFKANKDEQAGKLDIPVSILGLGRPVLSYEYQVEPIVLGEKTRIYGKVKNIGQTPAEEPVILLKTKGDTDIYVEDGREKLKALQPGKSAGFNFSFTQPTKSKLPEFQIQLYDTESGVYWTENIDIEKTQKVKMVPPVINWLADTKKPITSNSSYRVKLEVIGDLELRDAYLYVNDQKVIYTSDIKEKNGKNIISLNEKVKLKPGVNQIVLVARAGENFSQRDAISVFSESGDPLARKD